MSGSAASLLFLSSSTVPVYANWTAALRDAASRSGIVIVIVLVSSSAGDAAAEEEDDDEEEAAEESELLPPPPPASSLEESAVDKLGDKKRFRFDITSLHPDAGNWAQTTVPQVGS